MKTLLTFCMVLLLATPMIAADWSFVIQNDATAIEDAYLNGAYPDNNYDGAAIVLGASFGGRKPIFLFATLSDTLALGAYQGNVDSLRIGHRIFSLSDMGTNDTVLAQAHAVKRLVVESEATWNSYSTGNAWQTAGATGADDIYTDPEVASDTAVFASSTNCTDGFNCVDDTMYYYLDPDHVSNEIWIIVPIAAAERVNFKDTEYGIGSFMPFLEVWGHTTEAPAATAVKIGETVKFGETVKIGE